MAKFSESVVDEAALDIFEGLGYAPLHGDAIALLCDALLPKLMSGKARINDAGEKQGDDMIEIYPNLFIGNEDDYERLVKPQKGWRIVHACKEPYHRQALGYTGRAALKSHPEYLIARREHRLILNLVDAPNPAYIPEEIIDAALDFIRESVEAEHQTLVHCNLGESRSPSIGLLYLARYTDRLPTSSFAEAENTFRASYPAYNPGSGIRGFMIANWEKYTEK